jgi:predicted MFS family arabinose efflux permease
MSRRDSAAWFALALVALAFGHTLSNLVRTIPAIAADLLRRDLGVDAQGLAWLTGAYFFAFTLCQIPVGVALDRFGIRPVSLALIGTVAAGALIAALAPGASGFLLGQVVMGAGCSGMLVTPMAYAGKVLAPAKFGLWSGMIQTVGNMGMLLSASPAAWLIEAEGWRASFLAASGLAVLAFLLVRAVVPVLKPDGAPPRSIAAETRQVIGFLWAPALLPLVVLSFASFAPVIGVRGLWGGPWLMDVKGLSRVEAGDLLLLGTLTLIVGPALSGVLDRRFGRRVALIAGGHLLAAGALLAMAAGGALPAWWDLLCMVAFGLGITVQPLVFALVRDVVPAAQVGKAMSGVNLSFFAGAGLLQAASGPVAAAGGPGAAILFLGAATGACALAFLWLRARGMSRG